MPAQNNAQAGAKDMGSNAAPNVQAPGNTQVAANMTSNSSISSDPSPTQRKGIHLSTSQRSKADAAEAETTKALNQQAAAQAAPSGQ